MALVRRKKPFEKLSGWTALGVVLASIAVSKYLSTNVLEDVTQISDLETKIDLSSPSSSSNQPTKLTSASEQLESNTEWLKASTNQLETNTHQLKTNANISSRLLNKPTKPISALEQEVYERINHYRTSRHLPPLALDPQISEQARIHSEAMASGELPFEVQEMGFDLRGEAISKVIPYRKISEMTAYNSGYADPVRAAVNSWLRDAGRCLDTIEGDYELTGIGVATNIRGEYYFTQILVRRQ